MGQVILGLRTSGSAISSAPAALSRRSMRGCSSERMLMAGSGGCRWPGGLARLEIETGHLDAAPARGARARAARRVAAASAPGWRSVTPCWRRWRWPSVAGRSPSAKSRAALAHGRRARRSAGRLARPCGGRRSARAPAARGSRAGEARRSRDAGARASAGAGSSPSFHETFIPVSRQRCRADRRMSACRRSGSSAPRPTPRGRS